MAMWSRRVLLKMFGVVVLTGCAGGGSGDVVYVDDPWHDPFYHDDWIYFYDEDDEDFLAGLDDDHKEELKKKWDSLPPEEKQEIRGRWGELSEDERARVREAWGGLDLEQRQRVVSSMQERVRSGTLQPVTPVQAGPSRFQARSGSGFNSGRTGAGTGSFNRSGRGGRGFGSFGGRGGGRVGRR